MVADMFIYFIAVIAFVKTVLKNNTSFEQVHDILNFYRIMHFIHTYIHNIFSKKKLSYFCYLSVQFFFSPFYTFSFLNEHKRFPFS